MNATDYSGCGNDGLYVGSKERNIFPLTAGTSSATKIDSNTYVTFYTAKDYTGNISNGGFATMYTSDNDFTLEAWIYPNITAYTSVPIVGDVTNNVGLFWENNNLVFNVGSDELIYTVPYYKKAFYLAAVYTNKTVSLYIDGYLVKSKEIVGNTFSNEDLSLQAGPASGISDSMLINSVAVYRHALNESKILLHYNYGQSIPPIQVVTPDNGWLFEFYDNNICTQFSYSYPANKSWSYFLTSDLYHDEVNKSIEIASGTGSAKTVVINDFITIPSGPNMDDSRIEWYGDNGVTVRTSVDGINYLDCVNGHAIPQYRFGAGQFDDSRDLYIEITLDTTDDSIYNPKLDSLSFSFYSNQIMYSSNSGLYFSKIDDIVGLNSQVNLSNNLYPALSRDRRNGLRTEENSGFYIDLGERQIKTIELFYTPEDIGESQLFSSLNTDISWDSSETVNALNIDLMYINGVAINMATLDQTPISSLLNIGDMNYITASLVEPVTGLVRFNLSTGNNSVAALYQNIAFYEEQFNQAKHQDHFKLYTGYSSSTSSDSSLTVTENSVEPYDNNWEVLVNV